MNPVLRFYVVEHLFTKVQATHSNRLQGIEPLWSIYAAKMENEYPPILIFDKERRLRPQSRELCLAPIDESDGLLEYVGGLSPAAYKQLVSAIKENGVYVETGEDAPTLDQLLARSGICYRPVSRIRDIYEIETLEWEPFVDRLIRWDAEEKDPRLCLAHKAQLLRGIEPRLNAHALIVTNAGTGKSIHYQVNGIPIDKATKNAFLGYAKSPREVYKGTVDGEELPIGVDQIEIGAWGIMDYMFNIMEYGEATVSSGATKFPVKSWSPYAFMANPLTDVVNVEKSFGILMDHISRNPAIGRRFGVLIYGTDYAIIKTRSTPESLDQWRRQTAFFRAIEEAARPELQRIMWSQEVWDWINREIQGYAERMDRIAKGCNDDTIRVFFMEHGRAGQSRVRAAALQVSLVDYLQDIALGRYSLEAILDHAEEVLPGFTRLNLESAINIVRNIGDERRFMAEHWLEMCPEYMKEIVYAVEYARRSSVLGSFFNLGDIDYRPAAEGYSHLSVCISKLVKRKRGLVEWNQRCREYFGFSFQPQGSQLQVILESRTPVEWLSLPGYDKPKVEEGEAETPHASNIQDLYRKAEEALGEKGWMWAGEFWDTLEKLGHPRKYAEYPLKNPDSPVEFVGFKVRLKEVRQ
ncbi:MAG: hypothetical protein ABIJ47_06870 [Candidatus Bathyarchaeota archaeon]